MAKGSTKYQLLKDDFDHACRELKIRNELIADLRKENEQLKKGLDLILRGANPKPTAERFLRR